MNFFHLVESKTREKIMDHSAAEKIAAQWLSAWNRHDLAGILDHYAPTIVFTSPFVAKLTGDATGTLRGKEALRVYFAKGLAAYPDLKFEPLGVLAGVNSLVVYYESVGRRLSAEFMELDRDGKVCRVDAHYQEPRA
jgi:hypothetical protein